MSAASISRRQALKLGAAAVTAAALPAAAAIVEAAVAPAPESLLPAWFVGTPGDWDWHVVRGKTKCEAIADWCSERGIEPICGAVEGGKVDTPEDDCLCGFCYAVATVEVERKPALDAISEPTKAQIFANGLGQYCDRCDCETYPECDGHAVGANVLCEECMTLADWEIVDPERAREMREELGDDA